MTETRLVGMADGSVVTQALVDGVWTVVADAEQTFVNFVNIAAREMLDKPRAVEILPRRGRAPK